MSRTRNALTVPVLLSLGLFLRVLNLGREMTGDSTFLEISQLSPPQILSALIRTEIYPPFSYILMHYWLKFDQSVIWIRLYFVLFGLGACILIYFIGREYLDEQFARIALLLSVFSPLLIFASQCGRSYMDSTFWILLSIFFMLKLIKGRTGLINWSGYIIAAAISIYTFYFSALLVFAQIIFITIFKWKDKGFLFKWYLSLILVGLIFMPWLPSAVAQFRNASSIVYDWSDKGFNIGFLRLGLYTRNIFSLVGFDPYFMVLKGEVTRHFGGFTVLIVIIASCIGLGIFLLKSFEFLKDTFCNNKIMIWFLPALAFLPLLFSWVCAGLLNMLPNARYLVSLHAIFLMLVALFLHVFSAKKRLLGNLIIIFVLLIYIIRIPPVVSSEFGTEKAVKFLNKNSTREDCIVCAHSCPQGLSIHKFIIEQRYIVLNKKKSSYLPLSDEFKSVIKKELQPFNSVWFYRQYGHDEIFGLNSQVDNFLKADGYKIIKIGQFENIDVVFYKR